MLESHAAESSISFMGFKKVMIDLGISPSHFSDSTALTLVLRHPFFKHPTNPHQMPLYKISLFLLLTARGSLTDRAQCFMLAVARTAKDNFEPSNIYQTFQHLLALTTVVMQEFTPETERV